MGHLCTYVDRRVGDKMMKISNMHTLRGHDAGGGGGGMNIQEPGEI